ncbi:MAG TPA: methyltransferase [Chloroflexota bacterium]
MSHQVYSPTSNEPGSENGTGQRDDRRSPSEGAFRASEADPVETLLLTSSAFVLARCLHIVAELSVADALNDTPQTPGSLATATGVDACALGRILGLLAANGIFKLHDGEVQHTPASRLLRTDDPQSMRATVGWLGSPIMRESFDALEHTVRTGSPAAEHVADGGMWTYLAEHPAEGRLFEEAMTGKAHGQIARVLALYDFSSFGVIGDIGGGYGHLLRAVLDTAPDAQGVLFELPRVIDQVVGIASERLRLKAGDFFVDTLPTCDAYVLMQVIHDWGDEQAVKILTAVRRVAPSRARLLLIETIIPDDPHPNWAKVLDIYMLTAHGGQERTRSQYAELLGAAGFQLERAIDLGADEAILEASPRPGWAS